MIIKNKNILMKKKEYFDPDYQGTNFYPNQQNYNYQNYEQGPYKKE